MADVHCTLQVGRIVGGPGRCGRGGGDAAAEECQLWHIAILLMFRRLRLS